MKQNFISPAIFFFLSSLCFAESLTSISLDKPLRTQTVSYNENQINRELNGINETVKNPNKSDLRCSYYNDWTVLFITWTPTDRRGALIKNDQQNKQPKCDLKTLAQQNKKSYLGLPLDQKYFFDEGTDYGKFTIFSKEGQILVSDSNAGELPKFFKTTDTGKIAVRYKLILAVPSYACSNWSCSGPKDIDYWKKFNAKNQIPGFEPPKCLSSFLNQNGAKTNLQITIPIQIDDLEKPREIKKDFQNIACEIPG